jgi:hypothetical protein
MESPQRDAHLPAAPSHARGGLRDYTDRLGGCTRMAPAVANRSFEQTTHSKEPP